VETGNRQRIQIVLFKVVAIKGSNVLERWIFCRQVKNKKGSCKLPLIWLF